jgi:hypothetical protein
MCDVVVLLCLQTPLLQKPLRPELIPYNYHPALLPPQMNHRQPMSMNAPSTPLMMNRGSPDMVTIYTQPTGGVEQRMQRTSPREKRRFTDAFFRKYKERSKRIDVVSRLVFPTGFFVFNCVYWVVYLV